MLPDSKTRHYAVRQRRLSVGQAKAWAEDWGAFGLDASVSIDWSTLFPSVAPVVMEIGFGTGDHLHYQATAHPDKNFLGVELYRPGIGALLATVRATGLSNVRIFGEDVHGVLAQAIPAAFLETVHILFPDPWPKRRHHRRRLLQPDFIAQLVEKLQLGGYLHIATDWQPYAAYIADILSQAKGLQSVPAPLPARPETKFERRGKALGHPIAEFWYQRS